MLLFLVAAGLSLIFGTLKVTNFMHGSLYMLGAYFAYTLYNLTGSYQIAGYKDPSDDSRWVDIEARAAANATEDQIRLMFQSLLEDRFKCITRPGRFPDTS